MPQLDFALRKKAADIIATCHTLTETSPSVLATIRGALTRALDADLELAWGFTVEEDGHIHVDFMHQAGLNTGLVQTLHSYLSSVHGAFGGFNPVRPEPWQRNRVLSVWQEVAPTLPGKEPAPVVREMYPKLELDDHFRVLICDGPALLAYVMVVHRRIRLAPKRDKMFLNAVVPALRERMRLERLLGDSRMTVNALGAALDQVPSAAVVVGSTGRVHHANAAAERWLIRDRRGFLAMLRDARLGDTTHVQMTRLGAPGLPPCWLAVHRPVAPESPGRAELAASRWGLTPRQREVLCLLAQGKANRTIAVTLRCSERTVEVHVTAILAKAGVASRAALIAKVAFD